MNGFETKNVFIDTSIFIKMNFFYGHPAFVALRESVNQGRTRILLTDVTVEEVKANIREETTAAIQAIKKSRNPAKIFKNLGGTYSPIFKDPNFESITEEIIKQFEAFSAEVGAVVVPVERAITKEVFTLYFNSALPFGEGKKKSEFPDAFVLSALNDWADEEGQRLYVVSNDKDMKGIENSFKNLIPTESLEQYLNDVTFYFEKLAPLAEELLRKNEGEILERIKDDFALLGFILDDQDGDVYDVTVNSVGELSVSLLALTPPDKDQAGKAHVEITTTVDYAADVEYDNLDTAYYDSEDKVLVPWEKVSKTVEDSEIVQVDLVFTFEIEDPHDFEIDDFRIQTPSDVYVSADEDDGWPYK